MYRILLIPFLVIVVVLLLVAIVAIIKKRKSGRTNDEFDKDYIYRKEPHADQVTEHPNRLEDNDITRG